MPHFFLLISVLISSSPVLLMFVAFVMFLACTNATNWVLTAWHRPILESPEHGFTERSHIFVQKKRDQTFLHIRKLLPIVGGIVDKNAQSLLQELPEIQRDSVDFPG